MRVWCEAHVSRNKRTDWASCKKSQHLRLEVLGQLLLFMSQVHLTASTVNPLNFYNWLFATLWRKFFTLTANICWNEIVRSKLNDAQTCDKSFHRDKWCKISTLIIITSQNYLNFSKVRFIIYQILIRTTCFHWRTRCFLTATRKYLVFQALALSVWPPYRVIRIVNSWVFLFKKNLEW